VDASGPVQLQRSAMVIGLDGLAAPADVADAAATPMAPAKANKPTASAHAAAAFFTRPITFAPPGPIAPF